MEEDRKALGIKRKNFLQKIIDLIFPNEIWKFERILRYCEYFSNINSFTGRFIFNIYRIKRRRQSIKLGSSIPINVIVLGSIGLPTALMMASHGVEVIGTDYNKRISGNTKCW